jgi:hypothetical protein
MDKRGAYQKKASNIENVKARHNFLIEALKSPRTVNKTVNLSLMSQRGFAALELPSIKISPISLNTLKVISNEIFDKDTANGVTGFAYLDSLRIKLTDTVKNIEPPRSVEAKDNRIANKLQIQLDRLAATEAQSLRRQKAYLSLYAAVNGLVKTSNLHPEAKDRLNSLLENHHAAFANLFEPNIAAAPTGEDVLYQLPVQSQPK